MGLYSAVDWLRQVGQLWYNDAVDLRDGELMGISASVVRLTSVLVPNDALKCQDILSNCIAFGDLHRNFKTYNRSSVMFFKSRSSFMECQIHG